MLVDRQTHTHTHPFNGTLSRTTWVGRYRKDKTNLDFTEARDSELQWHQLGRMQVCTSLQADNHASTPPLSFYRPYALPAMQPTVSKHWRQKQKSKHTHRQTNRHSHHNNLLPIPGWRRSNNVCRKTFIWTCEKWLNALSYSVTHWLLNILLYIVT